jgi:galactitol-specific phosphotransferase system IIB component
MEFLQFGELLVAGFRSAFEQFQQQQERKFMALSADIQSQIDRALQNQNVSTQLITTTLETIGQETAQVSDAVTTLTTTTAQLTQTLVEKDELITQLLAQIAESNQEKAEIVSALDALNQQQEQGLASQQEAIAQISSIFTPNS